MAAQYSRDHCKIAVGKILQTIGWHSINSTPLEVLTDIFTSYIQQITKTTNDYANEFGQTEANLDHLGLALQEMGVNLSELEEYVTYVNFAPAAHPAPKFPVSKEDNLNFLKPGSKEVVTRPVHIHEHMPPMYPLLEGPDSKEEEIRPVKEECPDETSTPFKKPSDILSPEFRKPKREDEGSRPTREISSVMMTTSGFLSPAREGKLPEAKAPIPPPVIEPPVPSLVPTVQNGGDPNPKKKAEKRKEKFNKELFKSIPEERVSKKNPTMKDVVKMKQKNAAAAAAAAAAASNTPLSVTSPNQPLPLPSRLNDLKMSSISPQKMMRDNLDKALAAAKAKTEKLNTTITPIPVKAHSQAPQMTIQQVQQVEKLFNEPDRKKINILRKISNVKEGKTKKDSRASTPNLIIDEPSDIVNKISLSNDITIEPIPRTRTPENHYFDNGSPPGTPPTPRTPEILTHNTPVTASKEKRKRKDNRNKTGRVKKLPRKNPHIPFFTESELVDMIMERPKTPDVHHLSHLRQQLPAHMNLPSMHNPHLPFPFLANFGGPGLIPPPLTTPMFPFAHLGNIPNFGKNPYFPSVVPNLPPQIDPMPLVSPKVKEPPPQTPPPPVEIKPVEILPQRVQPPPPLQPIQVPETSSSTAPIPKSTLAQDLCLSPSPKKVKEHKKEKKDKIKKKNKKDKVKEKSEKKKIKELKKDSKVKREKKIKKKEKDIKEPTSVPADNPTNPVIPKMLLKVNSPSPRPETPEATRKLNIKPIVKKDEEHVVEDKRRDPSPGGLARISALVTGPPKPKSTSSPLPPPIEKPVPEEIPAVVPPKPISRPRSTPSKPKPPPKPKKVCISFYCSIFSITFGT
nr:transcription initiation factor TFIID subunit 3 isoform X1 [Leptinotarsa decemlineata]